ncbi:glycerophosphodiester phosphodiesterase family protein [Sphingobacterium sp. UT-1RO-CII-1]|uniref:glycerophosphodiester phosphodiesterase family protein n=1 Tax=Sphingobacterium sp. UT-1RO-CII-1 TaxID=2995225 RepID=UPI00227B9C9A|nr:glycerophosphodiester phosphodiesterase family protein [Sphingobacterium sp. UT-1RO-CII-1]MCY4779964.1 glycerophosphodiester phosphodiesterase family protein [Sphingobacterium sp. UT-1RO-CII-1]
MLKLFKSFFIRNNSIPHTPCKRKNSSICLILVKAFLFGITTLSLTSCFRANQNGEFIQKNISDANFNLKSVEDLYQFLTYSENRVPLISAHRGGPASNYPENAIETFQHIAKKMPVIIECDINMTKDSILILMHDATLERTSTGKGKVNEHSFEAIKKLKLKDNQGETTSYRIPTLEQALEWGAGRVIFTLDVKKNVPYNLVIDAIRNKKAEANSIIITYSAAQAAKVNRLAPDLMISASIKNEKDLVRLNDYNIPDTRLVAFIGSSQADSNLINTLHQHGIMCILGTMGNLDRQAKSKGEQMYAEYIENGADILSTDRPIEAGKALNYYTKKRKLSSPYIN